jgi:hypothetical protein
MLHTCRKWRKNDNNFLLNFFQGSSGRADHQVRRRGLPHGPRIHPREKLSFRFVAQPLPGVNDKIQSVEN